MDLPSYDEVEQHPQTRWPGVLDMPPPPTYDASVAAPSTPPPSYGEAVTFVPNHFPVLTVPSPQQHQGVFLHPPTQGPMVLTQSINVTQNSPVYIYQPRPVPAVVPDHLTDSPALVQCPHCGQTGSTLVTDVPSGGAWCMCTMLALVGLICGFCLIPLLVKSCQDTHHSCPHCLRVVHVYRR
ncbi:lipopolysaccharide-induced tumor necrosis factor-alpha factor homolog [Eucyclogobius newberryi]|uniref:lipopolysaccharide-induced tumor necrosis factor-alpha factor homolog n=1 Tax=Eucyclogobius newberryi TaxID=166745 RepID=UPI003B5C3CCB